MSNFQNQGKQSEYERDILIDFLMSKGYAGEMKWTSARIELSKDRKLIMIPNVDTLSIPMIKDVLHNAELSYSEFEEHLNAIQRMGEMIDLGLSTPPIL